MELMRDFNNLRRDNAALMDSNRKLMAELLEAKRTIRLLQVAAKQPAMGDDDYATQIGQAQ